jgi:hypothetical protein
MVGTTSEEEDESGARDPTDLDRPDSDENLYETYGSEEDDPLRPVFQGDVFTGITLAGYESSHHEAVMLVGHPCSLREGADLRSRLQAIAVRPHQRVPPEVWPTAYKQCLPLPALDDGGSKAALVREMGIVTREQVTNARRVATLSKRGILLLQQRLVWTLARTVVRLDTFEEHNAPQFTELELLEYWNEQLCDKCAPAELTVALETVAKQFEDYMREGGWREMLEQPERRTEVRRAARLEAEHRRAAGGP